MCVLRKRTEPRGRLKINREPMFSRMLSIFGTDCVLPYTAVYTQLVVVLVVVVYSVVWRLYDSRQTQNQVQPQQAAVGCPRPRPFSTDRMDIYFPLPQPSGGDGEVLISTFQFPSK